MNYYPRLLASIFKFGSGNAIPAALALSAARQNPEPGEPGHEAHFPLPVSLLPDEMPASEVEGMEEFPATARRMAAATGATFVFALPPITSRHSYSREWRDRYRRWELAEVLSEILLDGPRPDRRENHRRERDEDDLFSPLIPKTTADPEPKVDCVVLLVPRTLISSSRSADWRERFFPSHSATVIEHDHPGVPEALGLNINPEVRFATLIFQRHPGPIRFFKVTDAAIEKGPEEIAKDLDQLLRQPAGKTRYGFVHGGNIHPDYPCCYDFYSEETEKLRREIAVLGEAAPLWSVADVLNGIELGPPRREQPAATDSLLIEGGDITLDGKVVLRDQPRRPIQGTVRTFLQEGDFCVRGITGVGGNLVIGVFQGDGRAFTTSHSVIIVRPHPNLTAGQRLVLLEFLQSTICCRLLCAEQDLTVNQGIRMIRPGLLRRLTVPLADQQLSSAVEELRAARSAFQSWIEDIDRDSSAILEEATATRSRMRLLEAGMLAGRRHRAGEQGGGLDCRIPTDLSHAPILQNDHAP